MKRENRPATFGGSGFQYRTSNWSTDLGTLWQDWTVSSDGAPLQEVVLAMPANVYHDIPDVDAALMLERANIETLQQQCQQLAEIYDQLNITVHLCDHPSATPNWIFQRDLYCSTPKGIVLGRPASQQRRGEEVLMLELLAKMRAPIIYSIHQDAFFEGADLLWINANCALIGIGNRSNLAARNQLQMLYPNTDFVPLSLPHHIQHLLGLVNFISPNKVGIWTSQCADSNRKALQQAGLEIIDLVEEQEITKKRAFNWVCLGPNRLLLPEDAPKTIAFLRRQKIEVLTASISEYRSCGGGLGCLTGIVKRG